MKDFWVEAVAQTEFEEAAGWYETQRDGLGFEFIAEVDRVLMRIAHEEKFATDRHGRRRRRPPRVRRPFPVRRRVRRDQRTTQGDHDPAWQLGSGAMEISRLIMLRNWLCAARAPFRPVFAGCPSGTQEKATELRDVDEGASHVRHERWCERGDGTRHGPYASWDDPGPTAETGTFRDGKRADRWVQYYWGKKTEEGTYVDGQRDGRWLTFDERGIMTDSTYRDGVLNGPTRSYCNNGVVDEEGVYRDSERDGPWIWRYCSGRIRQTGTYAAGTEVEWKAYDESGRELDAGVKPAEK